MKSYRNFLDALYFKLHMLSYNKAKLQEMRCFKDIFYLSNVYFQFFCLEI